MRTDLAAQEHYRREHDRCLGLVARDLRISQDLTVDEIAKRAKVSTHWIQRLETNELKTNYTIGRLDRVARALGVDLYEFYKRASEMAGPPPWQETERSPRDE